MNISITKSGVEGRCEIICKNLLHLEVLDFDILFGKGCDVVLIDYEKNIVYIIECKCTSIKPGDDMKIINQINECVNYVKNFTKRKKSTNTFCYYKNFKKRKYQRCRSTTRD